MTQAKTEKIPSGALPSNEQERLDWLRLYRSRRVGPVTFTRLIREHGSAKSAIQALPEVARSAGVKTYKAFATEAAEAEINAGEEAGARLIFLGSPDYPTALATINDAPPILWVIGNIGITKQPMIAIVGARNSSSLGRRMSSRLSGELAKFGYVIVSGLARGIDAEAHRAAVGNTVAVQAGGVDNIYPSENRKLAEEIAETGLRISEMPIGLQPQARHFPRRNRIISGLSNGVVVIEAASRSGSLITARDALDQGREVMAVPGNPMDARAAGCNMLIRDGATLVRSAADVIEVVQQPEGACETRLNQPPTQSPSNSDLSKTILSLLSPTPVSEDQIIRECQSPPQLVMSTLVDLEMAKKLTRHAGGRIALPV